MAWQKQEGAAPPLQGHETLSMADQMRASAIPARLRTSPVTGAVENPRREFMRNQIQFRAETAARHAAPSMAHGMPIARPPGSRGA